MPPRIVVDFSDSWTPRRAANDALELRRAMLPGFVVIISPLLPLPEDLERWSRSVAEQDFSVGVASIRVLSEGAQLTATGWPVLVCDSVALSQDQAILEWRMHFIFSILEYGATIAVYAQSPDDLARHRHELMQMADSVRPDWGQDPRASLHELLLA